MPRDAPGWPPWPWDVQRVTWWLIKPMGDFSAAKESDFFRPTQLFCFFYLVGGTWLLFSHIWDVILPIDVHMFKMVKTTHLPTQLVMFQHEKHGGFPTHLISPRKTDRIFQSEAVFLKGELGQIQERAKAEFSAEGPWVSHGKSWRFPMGKTMENHGKLWENGSLNGKLPRKCWENPMIIDRSHRTQWRWGIFQPWSWLQENIG